jgi:hypothetical protein
MIPALAAENPPARGFRFHRGFLAKAFRRRVSKEVAFVGWMA